jgi:hypothetical protein
MIIPDQSTPFARISQQAIDDPRLTIDELAVLVYLASRPPNWEPRLDRLCGSRKLGRDRARAIIKGLLKKGYAAVRTKRSANGRRFGGFEYAVSSDPFALQAFLSQQPDFQGAHSQGTENTSPDVFQQTDSQEPENQSPSIKTERVTTTETRTERDKQRPEKPAAEAPAFAGRRPKAGRRAVESDIDFIDVNDPLYDRLEVDHCRATGQPDKHKILHGGRWGSWFKKSDIKARKQQVVA